MVEPRERQTIKIVDTQWTYVETSSYTGFLIDCFPLTLQKNSDTVNNHTDTIRQIRGT